jgi:hypothetical protein
MAYRKKMSVFIEITMLDQYEIFYVSEGMQRYGGSFVQALGRALAHADAQNALKIKLTWPEYWEKYLEFGKKFYEEEKQNIQ